MAALATAPPIHGGSESKPTSFAKFFQTVKKNTTAVRAEAKLDAERSSSKAAVPNDKIKDDVAREALLTGSVKGAAKTAMVR